MQCLYNDPLMNGIFDTHHIRRAFSRAAHSYDANAILQQEVEQRLARIPDYLGNHMPRVILDVGAGPGRASIAMKKRWPKAQVIALDQAMPMLQEARKRSHWWKPFAQVCGDARTLPVADASVDVIFSNLCLQWLEDLPTVLAGFRQALRPGGLLLCSIFGPETLIELREAFAQADTVPHISPFPSMAQFGDALVLAHFQNPVLDRDLFTLTYDNLPALMRALRMIGATNALQERRTTLTGRGRFAATTAAYEARRNADNKLPSSWEVIYACAWAPASNPMIMENNHEVASMPIDSIPIRRRDSS